MIAHRDKRRHFVRVLNDATIVNQTENDGRSSFQEEINNLRSDKFQVSGNQYQFTYYGERSCNTGGQIIRLNYGDKLLSVICKHVPNINSIRKMRIKRILKTNPTPSYNQTSL